MTARLLGSLFAIFAGASLGLFSGCNRIVGEALRPTGSACSFDSQCTSQSCNAPADGCGFCVELRALGQSCEGMLERCNPSAICRDGVCKSTKKTRGEPCMRQASKGELDLECDDELYCAIVEPSRHSGFCAPRGRLGGACEPAGSCALGALCEQGECVVATLAGEGDSCGSRACVAGLACLFDGEGHFCRVPTLGVGAECGGPVVDTCAPGASCQYTGKVLSEGWSDAVCRAWANEGESCDTSTCATGLLCREAEGTSRRFCQRLRTAGQACFTGECETGLECRGSICAAACE